MKNIALALIVIAVVCAIAGVISRLTVTPFAGIESRAMIGFAGLLLLFAIAVEGLK